MDGLMVLGRGVQIAYAAEVFLMMVLFEKPGARLVRIIKGFDAVLFVLYALFIVWVATLQGVDFLFRESGAYILFGFIAFVFYGMTSRSVFTVKAPSIGLLVIPIVLMSFSLGLRNLTPESTSGLPGAFPPVWLSVHILLAVVGEAALVVAALLGGLYLIEEEAIRRKKRLLLVFRLPPLEFLETTSLRFMEAGFLCLTFGLWIGSYYAVQAFGLGWLIEPKQLFAIAAWAVFGTLLAFKGARLISARKMAIGSALGLVLLLLVMVGVSVCPVGFHRFG